MPRPFHDIVRDIMRSLGLGPADLEHRTGKGSTHLTWWSKNPDVRPSPKTLRDLEEGLGVVFEFGEGARNVVGWRRKGEPEGVRVKKGMYEVKEQVGDASEEDSGVFDLYAQPLRELVDYVRRKYSPSTLRLGDQSMDEKQVARYEALYRVLVRKLESEREECESRMKRLIREFENELDLMSLNKQESKTDTGGA